MKLQIAVGEKTLHATLRDSATAREFVELLPLQLELKDYAGTEKISDLPKRLTTDDAPPGYDPEKGDMAYYAPWGNLAIFYRDFHYSDDLINLGKIEGDLSALTSAATVHVTIARAVETR